MLKGRCSKCGKKIYQIEDKLFDVRKLVPKDFKAIAKVRMKLKDAPPLDDLADTDYFLIFKLHRCRRNK